jgi:hypothetical protein
MQIFLVCKWVVQSDNSEVTNRSDVYFELNPVIACVYS